MVHVQLPPNAELAAETLKKVLRQHVENVEAQFVAQKVEEMKLALEKRRVELPTDWEERAALAFEKVLQTLHIDMKDFGDELRREYRYMVFLEAAAFVHEHNLNENVQSVMELNHFSLLSQSEFAEMYASTMENDFEPEWNPDAEEELMLGRNKESPSSWDWRHYGVVSSVRNQHSCGACWAFAAAGAIEGKMAIDNNYLFELSEQQFVSCFQPTKYGCVGGNFDTVFRTFHDPIVTDKQFPYRGNAFIPCPYSKVSEKGVVSIEKGSSLSLVFPDNDKIRDLALKQPVAVAVDSSSRCFQFYKSGILDDSSCRISSNPNHAILLVGFENYGEKDAAWIVKNSWSSSWGEDGFARIRIKPTSAENRAGAFLINRLVSIPTKASFASSCTGDMARCTSQGRFVNASTPIIPSSEGISFEMIEQVGFIFIAVFGLLFVTRWVLPKKNHIHGDLDEDHGDLEEALVRPTRGV